MKTEGLCSFQYGHPSQMQIFGKWEIIVINIVIMKDHKFQVKL